MRYAALALLLGALCLAGCGDDSGSSTSTSTTTAAESQNAEESIEGFGEEAQGSERQKLLATFHGYLGSIATKDYAKTCSYLSTRVEEGLEQFSGQAKTKKSPSCEEMLKGLLTQGADQIAQSQAEGQITKVRTDGETAFVVFHAPGASLYQLNLIKEGDEWKAASLSAAVLAPELPR